MEAALRDLLGFMEETYPWALEGGDDCSGETLCSECRIAGCIRFKIDQARIALAQANAESTEEAGHG